MAQLKVRNMIKKILLLISTMILALTIISCSDSPYGKKIEEDLTTTNIIDDNYRNYYENYGKNDLFALIIIMKYMLDHFMIQMVMELVI